ncbi:S24 family peptidase [Halopseudomonas pachastrellae]|nr:S24 family peptidase [Halopseudomonas pachastrellae]
MSAGKGSEVRIEDHGRKLRFGKRTLSRKNIIPECAACATVTGNSMEPVLPDGTTVGINTSITGIKDGQMYAIDHDGQLRVKVLYRRPATASACTATTTQSTQTRCMRLITWRDGEDPHHRPGILVLSPT